MKCYCRETDSTFDLCVEGVESARLEEVILHMAWVKADGMFLMEFSQNAFSNQREKNMISENFSRLGQAVFESPIKGFDWEKPLETLAQAFNSNGIEWYVVGSAGDALRGVGVKPFDIDVVIHTKDYFRAKELCYQKFPDAVIAPFTEGEKVCPLRFFGRLFMFGAMIDVAADEIWNRETRQKKFGGFASSVSGYEKTSWNGNELYLESLPLRYQIEIARGREGRVRAFEEYMDGRGIPYK